MKSFYLSHNPHCLYLALEQVPDVSKKSRTVSGLFDAKSTEFSDLLINCLIILAVAILLGIVWNYVFRIYLLRRNRVRPEKTESEKLQGNHFKTFFLPF